MAEVFTPTVDVSVSILCPNAVSAVAKAVLVLVISEVLPPTVDVSVSILSPRAVSALAKAVVKDVAEVEMSLPTATPRSVMDCARADSEVVLTSSISVILALVTVSSP